MRGTILKNTEFTNHMSGYSTGLEKNGVEANNMGNEYQVQMNIR